MQRRSVVFPEPDGPTIVTTVPVSTSSETFFKTCVSSNHLLISVSVTMGAAMDPGALVGLSSAANCTAVLSWIRGSGESVVGAHDDLGTARIEPLQRRDGVTASFKVSADRQVVVRLEV